LADSWPNATALLRAISWINLGLLVFNLFPIYPLDGGQILRSLLWFFLGRARSLLVASILGFVFLGLLLVLLLWKGAFDLWTILIAAFIFMSCWQGFRQARAMQPFDDAPSRFGYACPTCRTAPRVGAFWGCGHCHTAFDTFETHAQCPKCGALFATTRCTACGASHPVGDWLNARPPPPPIRRANPTGDYSEP